MVATTLDDLEGRGYVRMVHASHGARVVKYRQVLDERLAGIEWYVRSPLAGVEVETGRRYVLARRPA